MGRSKGAARTRKTQNFVLVLFNSIHTKVSAMDNIPHITTTPPSKWHSPLARKSPRSPSNKSTPSTVSVVAVGWLTLTTSPSSVMGCWRVGWLRGKPKARCLSASIPMVRPTHKRSSGGGGRKPALSCWSCAARASLPLANFVLEYPRKPVSMSLL